eukprot:Gb_36052 [translate_table: standard]
MMARLCASSFDTIFPKINHAYNSLRSYQPIIFHVSPSHIDSLSRPLGFSSLTTSREAYSHVHCLSRWKLWGKQNGMYNVTICRSKQVSKSASACSKIPIGLLNHQVERKIPYHGFTCLSSCTSDKLIQIYRTYSSHATDKLNKLPAADAPTDSSMEGSTTELSDMVGSNWMDIAKSASKTVTDAVMYTGTKAKETSEELMPILQQWVDSSPYLKDTLIPAGWTMVASILAWLVMPRVLRRLHMYAEQGSIALLLGRTPQEEVIYEKSIWGALEDPVRYMITFMAFTQLGLVVAPSTVASQYMPQIWRGAAVLSLVWFLHRWKSNVFARVFAAQKIVGLDRERFLALDKMSSVGLLVLGGMALAEACGVAVQSILTVGGIGGVATAFAARDILGNMLTGLSMQFSKPFSVGDTIKAGSIEGQVVEMGLTSTSMLNPDKYPVIVPNSFFSSQVIVNKSRARWRGMVTKVPVRLTDFEKIPQITEDIKGMLKNNPKVFLERESPYCFVSQIGSSYWEITISCNIKPMGKEELLSTEQDILLESARIVRKCGAELGSFL